MTPRVHQWIGCAALASLALAALPPVARPQAAPEAALTVLRRHLELTENDVDILRRGQPVTRTFGSGERREVTVGGAIRIEATIEAFLERFRRVEKFRESEMVRQIARFGEPPAEGDLAGLTVDLEDVESLRQCRPGACKVRLPAGVIVRFNREVDWAAADPGPQVSSLFRSVLWDLLRAYRAGGNASLAVYDDHEDPLYLSKETDELVAASAPLLSDAPEFTEFLARYPAASTPDVESFFYWSKDEFGFKPVISLTHVGIVRPAPDRPDAIIASKQIYANHYFDGSLAITRLLDDPAAPGRGFYMLYLNRTRNAKLAGFLGRLSRPMVHSRSRAGVERLLRATKVRLERPPS
jgi:hypothetical protein